MNKQTQSKASRRRFLKGTAGFMIVAPSAVRTYAANEKLNIAMIGVGGRGTAHLKAAMTGNLVALCDVDSSQMVRAAKLNPKAKKFSDYRKLFDKVQDIDACFISTPDHSHFPAAMLAIAAGSGVYLEKPLTHTIWEARRLVAFAKAKKVATQMGNQGHSSEGWRVLCERIWQDQVGPVKEVHAFTNRPIWPQGGRLPPDQDPVPGNLDWDAWIGPAPLRPYKEGAYHAYDWRAWTDFGSGALGDMGCHILDGAQWSLRLMDADYVDVQVEADPFNGVSYPKWSTVTFAFPARGSLPPCTLKWYDGARDGTQHMPIRPADLNLSHQWTRGNGAVYYGSRGTIRTGAFGDGVRAIPDSLDQRLGPPEKVLPRAKDHHGDFLEAVKAGNPTGASSHFGVSGPLTELVLLGALALQIRKPFRYDIRHMKALDEPAADDLIRRMPREGWDFADLT